MGRIPSLPLDTEICSFLSRFFVSTGFFTDLLLLLLLFRQVFCLFQNLFSVRANILQHEMTILTDHRTRNLRMDRSYCTQQYLISCQGLCGSTDIDSDRPCIPLQHKHVRIFTSRTSNTSSNSDASTPKVSNHRIFSINREWLFSQYMIV